MRAVGKADTGMKRKQNEDVVFISNDAIGILPNLYIVADGMGGHRGGEIASKLAVDAFCDYLESYASIKIETEDALGIFLRRGVLHANYVVYKRSLENSNLEGMGTTFTLCTIIKDYVYIAHIGDTRAYALSERKMEQLTKDHSYVQEMLDEGIISREELKKHPKRHMITRAIGTYEQVKVDLLKYSLDEIDYLLLCSDGLTEMVTEGQMHGIIYKEPEIEKALDELVNHANQSGGIDNIAIILIKRNEVNEGC